MEGSPTDTAEHQMFLSHDRLMTLESEVWLDYTERIERGSLTQEQAEILFLKWRAGYIDGQ